MNCSLPPFPLVATLIHPEPHTILVEDKWPTLAMTSIKKRAYGELTTNSIKAAAYIESQGVLQGHVKPNLLLQWMPHHIMYSMADVIQEMRKTWHVNRVSLFCIGSQSFCRVFISFLASYELSLQSSNWGTVFAESLSSVDLSAGAAIWAMNRTRGNVPSSGTCNFEELFSDLCRNPCKVA